MRPARWLANVPVKFSVDNGGVAPSGTATDKHRRHLTATIGLGEDQTNRKITVTATSGSITKSKTINVVDSVSGGQGRPTRDGARQGEHRQ